MKIPNRTNPSFFSLAALAHAAMSIPALLVAVGLVPWMAEAQVTLVNENFQSPSYANNTVNPTFTGWTWESGASVASVVASGTADLPVDVAGDNSNQAISINNNGGTSKLNYNTTHNWARGEAYTITLNASPMTWSGTLDRYIVASLLQTNGVVLWSRSTMMAKYNNFGRNVWTPALTFSYTILSDAFTTGVEGQPLRLQITQSGQRGIFVDNVKLEKLATPPPDTTAPAPNPMTWYLVPTPVGGRSITMIANTAIDDNYGVQYLFTNVTQGTSSGWQSSSTWRNTGLDDVAAYTYMVMARDISPNNNETAWSSALSATTKDPNSLVLISEGFQTPLYPTGTTSPYFPGWILTGAGTFITKLGGSDGLPLTASNQVVNFSWDAIGNRMEYDVYHNWARSKTYTLTLNAAPQSWYGTSQRYYVVDLLQTNGVLLWTSGNAAIPLYVDYTGQPWPAALTFTHEIMSNLFTAGAPGQPLRLRIYTTGQRGVYLDNVTLKLAPPAGTLIHIR